MSSSAAVSSMSAVVAVVHLGISSSDGSSKQGIRGRGHADNNLNEQLRRV